MFIGKLDNMRFRNGGEEMLTVCSTNSMINRLPMALCGIQHTFFGYILPVCPKLNDELQ